MKLSEQAVNRPIFTIMVVLIVIILGSVSLSRLSVDLMPDITYPTLSISTTYENASPQEIEELITRPIEEAVSAVPGVEDITSTSSEGSSNVRITFNWGTDLDTASNDIRDRLDRVISNLPDEASRPSLRKFDLAAFPVMLLGASGNLDPIQMRKIIDEQIKYRLERVPGVASMDVWGGLDREIHVYINPEKIKALRITLNTVLDRIRSGNINLPAGTVTRGNYEVTIRTPGEYENLDDLRHTTIMERNGSTITLDDIAEVEDSWEKVTRIVRINGKPGIRLAVNKQSGANTVKVANGVLDELEKVSQEIPQVQLVPIMDSSEYIKRSISNVATSAVMGSILAILVLLFFLRNVRSTFIIGTAIPVSVIATFGLIYFGNFTLNLMTLGGLALGIGMLVDNSIVVLENIYRLREKGMSKKEAAIQGSKEVSSAIIASTLTTLAVFLPLIFMQGMSGVMFRQLSYVVSFSLICSMFTALTLIPMLAGKLLEPSQMYKHKPGLVKSAYNASGNFFTWLENHYKRILDYALHHRIRTTVFAILLLLGSLLLIPFVGTELMPASDEGEVRISAEMEVGTKLELMDEKMKQVEKIIYEQVPEIENSVISVGGSHWRGNQSNSADCRINLVPMSQRSRSSEEVAQALRKALSGVPGMTLRVRSNSGLFIFRRMASSTDQIGIEIRGHDLDIALKLAEEVKKAIRDVDGITDAQLSRDTGTPEELIVVDRRKAADMRLTVKQVASTLQTVLSGSTAGNYREGGDEYAIRVQVKDADKLEIRDILDLTLTNSDGQPVILRNVVRLESRRGPVTIERHDQERVISVSANISGRDMGSIITDIQAKLKQIPVPRDFSILLTGDYEEQQEAFHELLFGFALALLLVYMVMACQYESLRDPFVVMFSVPLAIVGVVLILLITGTTFNIQSYIGCIMLGGIVVNNAILLVDTTNHLRRSENMETCAAIEEAGRRRLRPILMTAFTTILGLTPLAIGIGEGGEAQAPMARAVIGGLLSSTIITLVFVPIVYSWFEWRKKKC